MKVENTSDYITVELPSKGECYPCKKSSIRLERMTAMDENIVTSEELRQRECVCNTLLSKKLVDKNIDVEDLCLGDRNALLLALRMDGYGKTYTCSVMDEDGNETEKVVDLSEVKNDIFTMTGDKDGLFNYCDKNDNKYKFRFITHKDDCELIDMLEERMVIEDLYRLYLKKSIVSVNGKNEVVYIDKWVDGMDETILNKLFMFIKINTPGITFDYPIGDRLFSDIK